MKTKFLIPIVSLILFSCGEGEKEKKVTTDTVAKADTSAPKTEIVLPEAKAVSCTNDSLDELAQVIAGMKPGSPKVLGDVFAKKNFADFSASFEKKWNEFDTSRLAKLEQFRANEISKTVGETKTLFYPFSGPDFLYANAFFPEADKYILMGLEPVGTRPIYDQEEGAKDSLNRYFSKINSSLFTILNFSFFRTAGMKKDLRNEELNGTLHVLLLFIKRTGNTICGIKPVFIDTTGNIQYLSSFPELQKKSLNNKGVEITFTTADGKLKTLYYFSLHLEDSVLKQNKSVNNFFEKMGPVNTYLKGASYLMHESYFSRIRNVILSNSNFVIQDDSGIALRYFENSGYTWEYSFYGKYTRPISLFSYAYQKDLDSLYKMQGSKQIGFGIGYNFRDKNSNFMIAKRGAYDAAKKLEELPKSKAKSVKPSKTSKSAETKN
jgi:hypothetical protein